MDRTKEDGESLRRRQGAAWAAAKAEQVMQLQTRNVMHITRHTFHVTYFIPHVTCHTIMAQESGSFYAFISSKARCSGTSRICRSRRFATAPAPGAAANTAAVAASAAANDDDDDGVAAANGTSTPIAAAAGLRVVGDDVMVEAEEVAEAAVGWSTPSPPPPSRHHSTRADASVSRAAEASL